MRSGGLVAGLLERMGGRKRRDGKTAIGECCDNRIGAEVELEFLNTETAEAYLTLAALVADGFAHPRRPVSNATPGFPLG